MPNMACDAISRETNKVRVKADDSFTNGLGVDCGLADDELQGGRERFITSAKRRELQNMLWTFSYRDWTSTRRAAGNSSRTEVQPKERKHSVYRVESPRNSVVNIWPRQPASFSWVLAVLNLS